MYPIRAGGVVSKPECGGNDIYKLSMGGVRKEPPYPGGTAGAGEY